VNEVAEVGVGEGLEVDCEVAYEAQIGVPVEVLLALGERARQVGVDELIDEVDRGRCHGVKRALMARARSPRSSRWSSR
jgi:hypothetical protein